MRAVVTDILNTSGCMQSQGFLARVNSFIMYPFPISVHSLLRNSQLSTYFFRAGQHLISSLSLRVLPGRINFHFSRSRHFPRRIKRRYHAHAHTVTPVPIMGIVLISPIISNNRIPGLGFLFLGCSGCEN